MANPDAPPLPLPPAVPLDHLRRAGQSGVADRLYSSLMFDRFPAPPPTFGVFASFRSERAHQALVYRVLLVTPDGSLVYDGAGRVYPLDDAGRAGMSEEVGGVVFQGTGMLSLRVLR